MIVFLIIIGALCYSILAAVFLLGLLRAAAKPTPETGDDPFVSLSAAEYRRLRERIERVEGER